MYSTGRSLRLFYVRTNRASLCSFRLLSLCAPDVLPSCCSVAVCYKAACRQTNASQCSRKKCSLANRSKLSVCHSTMLHLCVRSLCAPDVLPAKARRSIKLSVLRFCHRLRTSNTVSLEVCTITSVNTSAPSCGPKQTLRASQHNAAPLP